MSRKLVNSHDQTKTEHTGASSENEQTPPQKSQHPIRRLLVFQVKLAVDAIRDVALSPVAIIATIIDLVDGRKGKARYFEKVMQFGRISERNINLFEQHKPSRRTVDNVFSQVEDILVNEYKNGNLSAKAKAAIESKLKMGKTSQTNDNKPG